MSLNMNGTKADLVRLLAEVSCPDSERRKAAEAALRKAEEEDFCSFFLELKNVLIDEEIPPVARQLAGILLKNSISNQDVVRDAEKRNRWIALPPHARSEVKKQCLALLTVELPSGSGTALMNLQEVRTARTLVCGAAAVVVAKIARLESLSAEGTARGQRPAGCEWPELLPAVGAMVGAESAWVRICGFQVAGYICQEIQALSDELDTELLTGEERTFLLETVSRGLQDTDATVKLQALKAFLFAVLFADQFIERAPDRHSLLGLVGSVFAVEPPAEGSAEEEVENAAWEVLLQIVTTFFDHVDDCMEALASLTLKKMLDTTSTTALYAIEFWSSIADIEIDRGAEPGGEAHGQGEDLTNGGDGRKELYLHRFRDRLLPSLYAAVATQDSPDVDPDEWTLSMAAGACVSLCAQVLKDEILPSATHFIEANFAAAEWNKKDAAILVYGSIIEGPSTEKFGPLLRNSFLILCKALDDPSVCVRDTTAWTIGRIAKHHFSAVLPHLTSVKSQQPGSPEGEPGSGTSMVGPGLIERLFSRLADEPRVAANICFSLFEIFRNLKTFFLALDQPGCAGGAASAAAGLSEEAYTEMLRVLAGLLLRCSQRHDAHEAQLRRYSYHALYALIDACSPAFRNAIPTLTDLCSQLLGLLSQLSQQPYDGDVAYSAQAPLLGCLTAVVNVFAALNHTDVLLRALAPIITEASRIATFKTPTGDHSEAAEDALLLLFALADTLPPEPLLPHTQLLLETTHDALTTRSLAASAGIAASGTAGDSQESVRSAALASASASAVAAASQSGASADVTTAIVAKGIELAGSLSPLFEFLSESHARVILQDLFESLNLPDPTLKIKPKALTALSDIAFAAPACFKSSLPHFLDLLAMASQAQTQTPSARQALSADALAVAGGGGAGAPTSEWIHYVHDLRDATLIGYTATLVCFRDLASASVTAAAAAAAGSGGSGSGVAASGASVAATTTSSSEEAASAATTATGRTNSRADSRPDTAHTETGTDRLSHVAPGDMGQPKDGSSLAGSSLPLSLSFSADEQRALKILIEQQAPGILLFLQTVTEDQYASEGNIRNVLCLTQDLINLFKTQLATHIVSIPFYAILKLKVSNMATPILQQEFLHLEQLLARYGVAA